MFGLHEQRQVDRCSLVTGTTHEYCDPIPELYLRAMVDSYSAPVGVLDETGTILYVNRGWRDFATQHGAAGDAYGVGRNYLSIRRQDPDAAAKESARLANGVDEVLLGRQSEFQSEYLAHNSIERRWIRIHATRFDLPQATRVLITQEDVTESRESTEARRQEAKRLQLLLNVTHILPWEADFQPSQFTYVGEQAVDMLGYPVADWYQPDFWSDHLHPDDRARAIRECANLSNNSDSYELEYRLIARDGRSVWLHSLVTVIHKNGRPTTLRGFSIDVTESRQTEVALRELGGRLINAQEEERRRIARELHDDLNQRMALLSIELEQLGQTSKPFELQRRIRSLQNQAREISADIHRLSYKLHPSKLDHLGLAAAIESLCHELSAKGTLEVELQQRGFPAILPKDVTLCVFRIAQEALRNCARHSGAASARVMLENTGNEIRLLVSDHGCGFEMKSGAMKSGLGFTSMRERLRLVGGEMKVQSRPMNGTVIEVSVPVASSVAAGPFAM